MVHLLERHDMKCLVLLLACLVLPLAPQTNRGPERGWLILEGGGDPLPSAVIQRFTKLAGGPQSSIVLIPTAVPDDSTLGPGHRVRGMAEEIAQCKIILGVSQITVLHTRDRSVADSEEFVAPLRTATGVWIMGGRITLLADAYVGTRTQREIAAVLDRGGVVGGTSAGAEIQGAESLQVPNLVQRADLRAFTTPAPADEKNVSFLQTFGFLHAIVIPHVIQRRQEPHLLRARALRPGMLVIGIDAGAAIVAHAGSLEVIGDSKVLIPNGKPGDAGLDVLLPGDRFDVVRRTRRKR
jgi:cyanophycinase